MEKAYKLRLKRVLIVTFRQFPIVKIKQVSQTENRENKKVLHYRPTHKEELII